MLGAGGHTTNLLLPAAFTPSNQISMVTKKTLNQERCPYVMVSGSREVKKHQRDLEWEVIFLLSHRSGREGFRHPNFQCCCPAIQHSCCWTRLLFFWRILNHTGFVLWVCLFVLIQKKTIQLSSFHRRGCSKQLTHTTRLFMTWATQLFAQQF